MASVSIGKFDKRVAVGLGEVLWSWQPLCDDCKAGERCRSTNCLPHIARAKRYLTFYEALVLDYRDDISAEDRPFNTHGDIWKAISQLLSEPDVTRAEFSEFILASSSTRCDQKALEGATALVVKIVCMTNCSNLRYSPGRLEEGRSAPLWRDKDPFTKYLQDLFPTQNHHIWSSQHGQTEALRARKSQLRATKLKKRLGLTFCPTHNIRDHLRLDIRRNELHIFHYASFIKEHLRSGRLSSHSVLLPRQLLLEVLDSTQSILFPSSDAKSGKLLSFLINHKDYHFDPELGEFEWSALCKPEEVKISYRYLVDRLEALFEESQSPQPRTWLEKRMQRQSGSRYIMLVTMIGVAVAVLLGVLALILSSIQTWIAYQAWKHPV